MDKKKINLADAGIDAGRFVKPNLADLTDDQVKVLASNPEVFRILEGLFKQVQLRAIDQIKTQTVSPNAFDISEKLDRAREQALDRAWYSICNLGKAAQIEIKARKDVREKKEVDDVASV